MHILQVVHCDLKPENIMYSRRLKKNIILDYGMTKLTEEKWGQKSLSYFQGTYEYCSDEMKGLFFQNEIDMIDLFKNDVIMADKTLTPLKFMKRMKINLIGKVLN
jgi:serine/threonine protein kinase